MTREIASTIHSVGGNFDFRSSSRILIASVTFCVLQLGKKFSISQVINNVVGGNGAYFSFNASIISRK